MRTEKHQRYLCATPPTTPGQAIPHLGGLVEEHVPEDTVVDLDSGDSRRSFFVALADHDGVSGQDLGLLVADVEGDGVDEALRVDLVVVDGSAVPDLIGGLVVDVGEVTAKQNKIALN